MLRPMLMKSFSSFRGRCVRHLGTAVLCVVLLGLHVASNSSFAPIGDYLSAQGEEAIALSFSKVEELTGKPLCKSAYKYASYWYPAQDRPLSNTIYNAGYDVDRVNLPR